MREWRETCLDGLCVAVIAAAFWVLCVVVT
jgi:hypothetical protein